VFQGTDNELPVTVFQPGGASQLRIGTPAQAQLIPWTTDFFRVQATSRSLARMKLPICNRNGNRGFAVFGYLQRIHVCEIERGSKKRKIHLYFSEIAALRWDPGKFTWPNQLPPRNYRQGVQQPGQNQPPPRAAPVPMLKFTTKMGCEILKKRHVFPDPMSRKWGGVLAASHRLRWNTVWEKGRVQKEAGLLWQIWYRAPPVNAWRYRINQNINTNCLVCVRGSHESVLHRFWECPSAQSAWQWGIFILNKVAAEDGDHGPWCPFN
jgi:hypothetical protein